MAKTLLDTWRDEAYSGDTDKGTLERLWRDYFEKEKSVYEQLLADPDKEVKGTVKELADKYGLSLKVMAGFLDGINDSLITPNPIEEMDENTEVSLKFDKELLYKNMALISRICHKLNYKQIMSIKYRMFLYNCGREIF